MGLAARTLLWLLSEAASESDGLLSLAGRVDTGVALFVLSLAVMALAASRGMPQR
jgi:hypothetical protein